LRFLCFLLVVNAFNRYDAQSRPCVTPVHAIYFCLGLSHPRGAGRQAKYMVANTSQKRVQLN
jgi:hypothetical protein